MLKPGDVVERYVVRAPLGEGGMGQVYRAWDERLQRYVALKILHPDASGGTGEDRILREARAAAHLEHPGIVAIHDVGEALVGGARVAYIAMELVEGISLRAYMRGEAQASLETKLRWLIDVARALEAAHARGLVHRDVKPENVMIRRDGAVKVLDFGIAVRSIPAVAAMSSTEAQILSTMTTRGGIAGTPQYMAPEQMRGEAIDGRADQFSWGIVAYELLSGELPWGRASDAIQAVATLMSREAEPLAKRAPNLPAPIPSTIMSTLARAPEARYASMGAVIAALESRDTAPTVESSEASRAESRPVAPIAAVTAGTRSSARSRRAWVAGAVAASALLAASLAARRWGSTDRDGARAAGAVGAVGAIASPLPHAECASNRACVEAHGGKGFACVRGACVALASQDCVVLADEADLVSDDTMWVGAMVPTGENPSDRNAIELARQDFAQMRAGFPGHDAMGRVPRIGVVACDDTADAARAANHLVGELHVPAVLGFTNALELINLAGSTLIPNDVLAIATIATSPLLATIPHRADQPRLVWRTSFSASDAARALGAIVPGVLEPGLRSARAIDAGRPLRVAFVRSKATRLSAFSDLLFKSLAFNGKSALDNGNDYREMVYDATTAESRRLDYAATVGKLEAFAPHVVLFLGGDDFVEQVIEPLEARWRVAGYRPRYATMGAMSPRVRRFAGSDAERRRRFFSVSEVSTRPANARFVMHYNEVFGGGATRNDAANGSYDGFYLLAYAAYALGDEPATGPSLARAMKHLVPPGKPIDVGVAGIFDAFTTLRRGESIDLGGALGALDFDLATGEAPVDQAVLCLEVGADGSADGSESGIVFHADTRTLDGALHCH